MELQDVDRVAVLGAGNMGHGIAEVAALAGYDVTMRDVDDELVQEGYDRIEWSLGKLVDNDRITDDEADAALDRVSPVVNVETAVGDADVVIEAVPERMKIKREVYADVEEHAPEDAVFATNTSSLSITELSEETDRPERFCGMHFFNPPVRMQLVEVIAGEHTAEATLDLVEGLAEAFEKTPVRVRKDTPGFVVNRVLVPMMNEACWIVEDDVATVAEVDSTVKYDLGLPMGAFELGDQVGHDVTLDVLEYMTAELGAAYEPCPLLERAVDEGRLGTKTSEGFYDYDGEGVRIPTDAGREDVRDRLLASMADETARLVDAGVADPEATDRALRLGAGFPEGPARMADDAGLDALIETLDDLHAATGAARYEAADALRERADAGGFYGGDADEDGQRSSFETLAVAVKDGVGRIVLDRPHRMNTVTVGMLDELDSVLDRFEADDDVRAILLTGAGDRAFSAGADVNEVAASAAPLDAVEVSRRGQAVFGRLTETELPVVAGIDGYCLGGGMELATCADLRVASERSELGQPELNLGILPGWGGTQRLKHVVGEGRAREIILTAERYDAATMADYGFLNEVVAADELEDRARELAADLAAGPPVATGFVKRAMLAGRESEAPGLDVESHAFGLLTTTDDLMEGVAAFAEDRDPEFEGR